MILPCAQILFIIYTPWNGGHQPPLCTHINTISPQFHCGTPAQTSETISQFTGADRPRKAQLGWARLIIFFFFHHNLPLYPSTSSPSPFSSHHIKSNCLDALWRALKPHWGGVSGLQEVSGASNGDSRQFSALLKAGFTSGQSSAMKGCVGMQSGGVLHKLTFKKERREGRRGQHSERDYSLLMSIWHQPPR